MLDAPKYVGNEYTIHVTGGRREVLCLWDLEHEILVRPRDPVLARYVYLHLLYSNIKLGSYRTEVIHSFRDPGAETLRFTPNMIVGAGRLDSRLQCTTL